MNIQKDKFTFILKKCFTPLYSDQIVFFLILFYVVSIFFLEISLVPNRIALFCLILFLVLDYLYNQIPIRLRLRDSPTQLFFILPFVFFLIYNCNYGDVMLNIIIPLLWIVLSSRPFTNGKAIAYLYKALNISICAAFLLCLTGVLLKLNDEIPKYWWNAFVHKSFTQALSQHPSYLSLYAVIAVNGNLDKLYNNIIEGRFSLLTVVFLVVSFAFVVLISAKMAYIILGLFFFIFLGRLLVAKKIKWALVFSAAFLTMTSVIYIALPSIYNRVTTDYSTFVKSDFKLDNTSPASERIYIWKTSFDIISESQLGEFCVKTKEQIWSRIEKKDKENLEEKNAHNNFLEFGLKYGVLGIILLLLFVCWCFNFFRKTRNFLFLGIVLTFLFFSLTESTLVREMGVIYMAFIFQIHIINISKRCIYE